MVFILMEFVNNNELPIDCIQCVKVISSTENTFSNDKNKVKTSFDSVQCLFSTTTSVNGCYVEVPPGSKLTLSKLEEAALLIRTNENVNPIK